MRKVALYARVSTGRQSQGLNAQKNALLSWVNQNGTPEYRLFVDEAVSGARSSRPALDEMMKAAREREFDAIVVFAFSRFARSTKHLLESLEEFQKLGVEFVSLSEKVDTSSPMGRALFTILGAVGQLERELIAERIRNGVMNARRKGTVLGRPKTVDHKLIKELHSKGLSYREISSIVDCSLSTISRVLKSFDKGGF